MRGSMSDTRDRQASSSKKFVIAMVILIIGIGFIVSYLVKQPLKENTKPTPINIIPSFRQIYLGFNFEDNSSNNLISLESSETNITNESISMIVSTLDGITISTYKFNQNIPGYSYSPYWGINDKTLIAFFEYPDNKLNNTVKDILSANQCKIKIITKGNNSSDSVIEIRTIPFNVANGTYVGVYNGSESNYCILGQVFHPRAENVNVSYNYTIYDMNKKIISHHENLSGNYSPNSYFSNGKNEILIKIDKQLFNTNNLYTLDFGYTINSIGMDNNTIAYSGYINNMPFILENMQKIKE